MENKTGDSNRITREYFDSILLEMRHIDAVLPNTDFTLYGEKFSTPVMTAALSHLDHFGYHKDGMVELAKGAKAANAVMWAGMGSETELERIIATGAKTIKICKPEADNEIVLKKLAFAEKMGCFAIGIDVDHAFNWKGEYDEIEKMPMRPKTLDEIKMFVQSTKLPFIIKGVLSVQDALKCAEAGVQGIVVSHHHGIMDFAIPPLKILPKIKAAVGDGLKIFVDCSVENGYDTFKALALGADAVSAGRSLLPALSAKGGEGVAEKINEMTQQLTAVMARTCTATVDTVDSSLIYSS
ncbi:MAG: alpha-hydroxy-acid oxidizing protein [Defluviitaleaceae bacterium]|nr:alpha-hydroxy-acid oxidizing protein [Defluviitaleaceae bacterium]MCL2264356.1 alpha-hydroxy-acid oxidizing protein [Defluviitaleaceae bacterium]